MILTQSTFRKSLIVMSLLSTFSFTHGFDYTKAATTFVDNTTGRSGDLFSKGYYVGGAIGQSEASGYCNGSSGCEDSDTAWKIFWGLQITR